MVPTPKYEGKPWSKKKANAFEQASQAKTIHLTEDNLDIIRNEINSVRKALVDQNPDNNFRHLLRHLDPDAILPKKSEVEDVLCPEEEDLYGGLGMIIKSHSVPHGMFLAKWVGVQQDVDTPFLDEMMMWVHRVEHQGQMVVHRSSHWRYSSYQRRLEEMKNGAVYLLRREIQEMAYYTRQKRKSFIETMRSILFFSPFRNFVLKDI